MADLTPTKHRHMDILTQIQDELDMVHGLSLLCNLYDIFTNLSTLPHVCTHLLPS